MLEAFGGIVRRCFAWVGVASIGLGFGAFPAWAGCDAPYSSDQLIEDLSKVEDLLRKYDNDGAGRVGAAMEAHLACLGEAPLPPMIMGRAYRAIGGGLYVGGNLRRGLDWFSTAIVIDPTFGYGLEDLPSNHPVLNVYAEAQRLGNDEPVKSEGKVLAPGTHYLDGKKISSPTAVPGIPHIYQWKSDSGIQAYLITGTDFPMDAVIDPTVSATVAAAPVDKKGAKAGEAKPAKVAKVEPPKPDKAAKVAEEKAAAQAAKEKAGAREAEEDAARAASEAKAAKVAEDRAAKVAEAKASKVAEEKAAKAAKSESAKVEVAKTAKTESATPAKPEPTKPAKTEPVKAAKAEPAKPSTKPSGVKTQNVTKANSGTVLARKRPPEKTPLMIAGAALMVGAGGVYYMASQSREDFDSSILRDEADASAKRTNRLVLGSVAALAVGAGSMSWGVILDGGLPMPVATFNIRF